MIRLTRVTRKFSSKVAVDGLDLHVDRGELFAFLGPNGAGKTTTIKMLVGLLRPTEGEIAIDGVPVVTQPRQAKSRVGYVPDQPELYDKLTGREFLRFVGRLRGMQGHELHAATESVVAKFELRPFVDHLTEGYSHGMKQRVAFAAALIHEPPLLVLDEPMVGLDPRSMRLVKDLLRQRARQGGTVFLSTHTLAMAEEIADRIGVIHHGRLRFVGTF
ncbi:MAG TPA: ABC transporter ATP-binding protein, partial [Pirellulaceae bacterium]